MSDVINQYFSLNDEITQHDRAVVNLAAKELLGNVTPKWFTDIFIPTVNVKYLELIAKEIRTGCKHLVIIGTGASSNIPKILFSLIAYDKNFQIHFLEDADTFKFENLISKLDHQTTRFLVISKSGRTIEIISLVLLCIEWIKKQISTAELNKIFHFITSSQTKDNYLLQIANNLKSTIIEHPSLSGRFSCFNTVGLLPAAIAGFNLNLILKHASWCIETIFKESSWILEAATYFITMSNKYNNSVLMTYSNIFYGIATYIRQLISESLGKKNIGINPILFEGNIDQHSQLQSYLEGLSDKFFTILIPSHIANNNNTKITNTTIPELTHLKGKSLSDINILQTKSVINLLKKKGKNLRIVEINSFNEIFISEIITCFMLETILYAKVNNIDPFTQTAIESMKDAVEKTVI